MLTAVKNRSTAEKPNQPIEMMSADDPAEIRAVLRIFSIELDQRLLEIFEKLRGDILEDENVIRRGTALTGINPTPESDAASCNF
jgi:hypothetical protein